MKKQILILTTVLFSLITHAQELQTSVEKAPAAPPKWKASASTYYYNFEGTKASTEAAYSFDNATLNMELLTLQYQYSPEWTFQMVGQYLDNYVETKMFGTVYKDRSTGFGDVIASAIHPVLANADHVVLVDVGVSLPTGDINQENKNAPGHNLAYNMQNGSGTVDAVTGLTGLKFMGPVQLGGHLTGIFRNGDNANGYHLGNLYRADVWADYNTKWGVTPRLVGYYKHKEAVVGYDKNYVERQPYSEFYYHPQINWDLSAALKYSHAVGPVALAAEIGVPVAQNSSNYDNVVVSTEYFGNISVAGSF